MPSQEDCECALCHELMVHPVVLPCAHAFCKPCLSECLHSGPASRRCPLCRRLLHATSVEDLAVCNLLSSLLEEKFPEEYQKRCEQAKDLQPIQQLSRSSDEQQELPLFVLDAMLPLQRLHLNVFEPRYRALVRLALASGRRFGMVGFSGDMGHLQHGVEVVIEDCMQTSNGHFQVRIVGTRIFRILEASQHQDGYVLATVTYPIMEDQATPGPEDVDVEELLKDLKDWQDLVRADRPQQMDVILRDLGPRPSATQRNALALWAAALLNPLPPLGLAPELRPDVLGAENAEARLRAVRRGLDTSLAHLRALSKNPLRRWFFYLFRLPAPVMMTSVMVCACLISAIFPGAK